VPSASGGRLDDRFEEAAENAERFFIKTGKVHHAAVALAQRLEAAQIPYAIAGAMALGAHGYERVTSEVNLLVTREGLSKFKALHLGRGYVEKFPGSKGVRDTENDVNIDVLLAGDFPGDGKPKPVSFPDPSGTGIEGERFRILSLPKLVELKLASGMTAPHRLKDLADVLELIQAAGLPADFADRLDPFVRAKYDELWRAAQTRDPE
jgi:hypothetical protein